MSVRCEVLVVLPVEEYSKLQTYMALLNFDLLNYVEDVYLHPNHNKVSLMWYDIKWDECYPEINAVMRFMRMLDPSTYFISESADGWSESTGKSDLIPLIEEQITRYFVKILGETVFQLDDATALLIYIPGFPIDLD